MKIRTSSVPSEDPKESARSKREVATERHAKGLPHDESRCSTCLDAALLRVIVRAINE